MVDVLGGFSLSDKEFRAIDFIFKKYAKEHYDFRTNDKSSFKFKKIAISKPIIDGDFKDYRLIAMSGISDYSMDMECITTSYKLDKYADQEQLSMAGWTASRSIGDAGGNSKESFFEGKKYARGYIQK